MKKVFLIIILVASILGLIDAVYLTIQHYNNAVVPCTILSGCGVVLKSSYAVVLGLPLSLVGTLYYLAVFVMALMVWRGKNSWLKKLWSLVLGGFIFTLYFIYLQIFVIEAWCIYCLVSALMTTTIFLLLNFLVSEQKVLSDRDLTK